MDNNINLDNVLVIVKYLSIILGLIHCIGIAAGFYMHKRISKEPPVLWYLSLVIHVLFPVAAYKTERMADSIAKKKQIAVGLTMGRLNLFLWGAHLVVIITGLAWFALQNNPDWIALKMTVLSFILGELLLVLAYSATIYKYVITISSFNRFIAEKKKALSANTQR
ncbi:hypothetical protein ACI2KR_08345 [Pseudomonas luteola]